MGMLDRLLSRPTRALNMASLPVVSPYADDSALKGLVISEALGVTLANLPMSHERALTIPAVEDAIGLLTSSVAKFPLVALDANNLPLKTQPPWLSRDPDGDQHERMTNTVECIAMHGHALWLTTRGSDGFILDATFCPRDLWSEKDGEFYYQGRDTPLLPTEYILFNPRFRGLLNIAARNLRGAIDVEAAWHRQARNPIPLMVLQMTDDTNLTADEVKSFVQSFSTARNSENGAVGYLPAGVSMQVFGESDPELMTTGRNATKNDVSSYLGIPAAMLDGTVNEASLTYVTTEGTRNRFYDFSLPRWTDPIAYRLSRDDVTPRGTHIAFDMYSAYTALPLPTGPALAD